FFTRLPGYAILAQRIPSADRLEDLVVYDLTRGLDARVVMKAARGRLVPEGGERVSLVLEDGSVERDAPGGPVPASMPLPVGAPPPGAAPVSGFNLASGIAAPGGGRTERVRFAR